MLSARGEGDGRGGGEEGFWLVERGGSAVSKSGVEGAVAAEFAEGVLEAGDARGCLCGRQRRVKKDLLAVCGVSSAHEGGGFQEVYISKPEASRRAR